MMVCVKARERERQGESNERSSVQQNHQRRFQRVHVNAEEDCSRWIRAHFDDFKRGDGLARARRKHTSRDFHTILQIALRRPLLQVFLSPSQGCRACLNVQAPGVRKLHDLVIMRRSSPSLRKKHGWHLTLRMLDRCHVLIVLSSIQAVLSRIAAKL
jgi:hypothetical protein